MCSRRGTDLKKTQGAFGGNENVLHLDRSGGGYTKVFVKML